MLNVPYNVGPQTVTVYGADGVTQGARTPQVIEAIKAGDLQEVLRLLAPVNLISGALAAFGDVVVTGGAVLFKGREVNNASAQRLLELSALGLPLDSEVKCLASLMRHDDARVIASFEDFIQRWNVPRVSDGRIVLCKGVRSDFLDGHSRTVNWSVGQTVRMSWDAVDRDPSNTCSRGLHAAPLEGARNYAQRDGHLIELYIWPEHIAALPYDYTSCGKVRVVEAFVSRVIPRDIAEQYYDFAPLVYDAPEDESEAYNPNDAFDDNAQDESELNDETREHFAIGYTKLTQSEVDADQTAARASLIGVVFYRNESGELAYGRPSSRDGLAWSSSHGDGSLGAFARFALDNVERDS